MAERFRSVRSYKFRTSAGGMGVGELSWDHSLQSGRTAKASLFLHRSKEIQDREVCPVRCTHIIGSPGPELRLKREKKPRTGKELHASSVPHSGSNFSAGAFGGAPAHFLVAGAQQHACPAH